MKTTLICLMLLFPFLGFAQKVETNDSLILVDNARYVRFEKEGHGAFQIKKYTFYDNAGKAALLITWKGSSSPSEISRASPRGEFMYAEFIFFQSKQKAHLRYQSDKTSAIAKLVVKNKLFKDGQIDQEAVDNFVLINPEVYRPR